MVHEAIAQPEVPQASDIGDLMTTKEAAAFLKMSSYQLGELARAGKVPYRQPVRRYLFSKRDLRAWLERSKGVSVDDAVGTSVAHVVPTDLPRPQLTPSRPRVDYAAEIQSVADRLLQRKASHG
jgi:excisionase family DNA binding protein